jgi:hypothetical protein
MGKKYHHCGIITISLQEKGEIVGEGGRGGGKSKKRNEVGRTVRMLLI